MNKSKLPKHSTEYLFGIEPQELEDMLYPVALQYKLDMGRELYRLLMGDAPQYQDTVRMHWVLDAIHHTEKLINELKERW